MHATSGLRPRLSTNVAPRPRTIAPMSLRDHMPCANVAPRPRTIAPMSLRDHMPSRRFRSATKFHDAIIQSRSDVGREPGTSVPGNVHHPVGESRSDVGRAASIIIAGFPLTPIVAPRLAGPNARHLGLAPEAIDRGRSATRNYGANVAPRPRAMRQRRSATKSRSANVAPRPSTVAPTSLRDREPSRQRRSVTKCRGASVTPRPRPMAITSLRDAPTDKVSGPKLCAASLLADLLMVEDAIGKQLERSLMMNQTKASTMPAPAPRRLPKQASHFNVQPSEDIAHGHKR